MHVAIMSHVCQSDNPAFQKELINIFWCFKILIKKIMLNMNVDQMVSPSHINEVEGVVKGSILYVCGLYCICLLNKRKQTWTFYCGAYVICGSKISYILC